MAENNLVDKSRKMRRKESRLEKNKKKSDLWKSRQHSRKLSDPELDPISEKTVKALGQSTILENSKVNSESSDHDNSSASKSVKRKNDLRKKSETRSEEHLKTDTQQDSNAEEGARLPKKLKMKSSKKAKLEKYLAMDMLGGVDSVNEDLALERKLAKKLKVKGGKLRGDDDELNMLFEGLPSVQDSLVNEEDSKGSHKSSTVQKKRKRKSSEQDPSVEMKSETVVFEAEQASKGSNKSGTVQKKRKRKSSEQDSSVEMKSEKVVVESEPVASHGGNAKYVAPQRRATSASESEEYSQNRKRVRGLLNRMSESNVESITAEVFEIFQSVARSVATQVISEEVLASCVGGPRGNEQYAAVFAAFVAGISCLVGNDFGAKLLASLARSFEDEYQKEDNLSLRNLTLLLSYLYIFGVCSSDLIYDFMLMLSKRLTEVDVSTILTILNCAGMKLRSDDPSSMKNFIVTVQNRNLELKSASENGQEEMRSKRMEFMLETICDIKNNKKRPKEDTVQHTRIKKWLQKLTVESILIRGLKWSKLIDPEKKGQWWLNGDADFSLKDNIEEVANKIDKEPSEAQKMLQLAAAQRMNTDARRAIFCIIMSGEDYIDAFEKLLRLELPGKQDREIMRVLVECCLQEKVFNKYYCVLASKLCSHDKNHKFTLQFCIWDHFKELESMQLIRSMHLSKFIAEMLASFNLSLAVLKVVDLNDPTQLTSKKIMHFRMIFEAIFEFSDKLVWNIFTRIAVISELEALRTGIKFFVSKYVIGSQESYAGKFDLAKKALKNVEGVLL